MVGALLCSFGVLAPVVMVAGVVFGSRSRGSALGRVIGLVALLTAWEVCWLPLIALAPGARDVIVRFYAGLWLLLQPVGLVIAWRVVFGRED